MFFIKLVAVVFSIRRIKRKLVIKDKNYKKLDLVIKHTNLINKVFLVASDKHLAFCFGFRNPRIFISTALVRSATSMELKAILLHEKTHLENRDTTTMFLATVTESLFPFFPVISDLIQNFIIEREIKADKIAVSELGSSKPLCSALNKLLRQPASNLAFVPSIGDTQTLEVRINTLINESSNYKKFSMFNILISLLSMILLSFVIFAPVSAMELHDRETKEDVVMVCLSSNECNKWCKENETVIPMSIAPNLSTP